MNHNRTYTTVLFTVLAVISLRAQGLSQYRCIHWTQIESDAHTHTAMRAFEKSGCAYVISVDNETLATCIEPAAEFEKKRVRSPSLEEVSETPYVKLLEKASSPPYPLANDGIRRQDHGEGLFLTADLCPSTRPFVKEMISQLPSSNQPIAVGFSVTGAWLDSHSKDLAWIKHQEASGRLSITWINHSNTHPYRVKEPLETNFLLTPGLCFENEVLEAEKKMIENGLTPSVFFRFPGLISSEALIQKLKELSLIALGSDAWLAKGEIPKAGSILLVHANGNEPRGIAALRILYKNEKASRFRDLKSIR